jgi:hypothetical protein
MQPSNHPPERPAHPTSESTLNLRLDATLKRDFAAAVGDRPVAEVLRSLMRDYVEIARRRNFTFEAHRQSQQLIHNQQETEALRWVEEFTDPEVGL